MNRKRWLLVALLVGCGAAVATMSFTIPSHTLYSSSNGQGLVTVDGHAEYSDEVERGDYDPETGTYPYVVPRIDLEDLPSGIYTGTVSVLQVGASSVHGAPSQVIGSCRVEVDAENGTPPIIEWFDGTLPPGGPGDPGAP